jgi:hypothetical protein
VQKVGNLVDLLNPGSLLGFTQSFATPNLGERIEAAYHGLVLIALALLQS